MKTFEITFSVTAPDSVTADEVRDAATDLLRSGSRWWKISSSEKHRIEPDMDMFPEHISLKVKIIG